MEIFEGLTLEKILEKVKRISTTLPIEENRIIYYIFYGVLKLSYYRLKHKKSGLSKFITEPIILKQKEITSLFTLIHKYYSREKEYLAERNLIQLFKFGDELPENEAVRFFEEYVEGECEDRFGRRIKIDLEAIKFMYKDKETDRHIMKSENYMEFRGKRLPWIRHTLRHTKNVFQRNDRHFWELLYVNKYNLLLKKGKSVKNLWIIIVKKRAKDKVGPFLFKTAFPIYKHNEFFRILEQYSPV